MKELNHFFKAAIGTSSFYWRLLAMLLTIAFILFRVPQINIFGERTEMILFGNEPREIYGLPIILFSTAIHAFGGSIAILIAPIQTYRLFHIHFPKAHYIMGKVYLVALTLSAMFGFIVSFTAEGGLGARLLLNTGIIVWGLTCFKTYWSIRQALKFPENNPSRTYWIRQHRFWAFYSYALALLQPVLYLVIATLSYFLRNDAWSFIFYGTPILPYQELPAIGKIWQIQDIVVQSYLMVFILNIVVAHIYLLVKMDYEEDFYDEQKRSFALEKASSVAPERIPERRRRTRV